MSALSGQAGILCGCLVAVAIGVLIIVLGAGNTTGDSATLAGVLIFLGSSCLLGGCAYPLFMLYDARRQRRQQTEADVEAYDRTQLVRPPPPPAQPPAQARPPPPPPPPQYAYPPPPYAYPQPQQQQPGYYYAQPQPQGQAPAPRRSWFRNLFS